MTTQTPREQRARLFQCDNQDDPSPFVLIQVTEHAAIKTVVTAAYELQAARNSGRENATEKFGVELSAAFRVLMRINPTIVH